MKKKIYLFFCEETAQSTVEYVLTATLLFVGCYWGYHRFSGILAGLFNRVAKFRTGVLGMGP